MPIAVNFVTSSAFKREEIATFAAIFHLCDGTPVSDAFEFNLISLSIVENLDVSLTQIVTAEAKSAYSQLQRPCVVEHAGLEFEEYEDQQYPGGLTKPMWNALGDKFLDETHSAGRAASAVAVVGYCDGKTVHTFEGRTRGVLADHPRGDREFYWDTVFVPDDDNPAGFTYAEIVERDGLASKLRLHSQSAKAMISFLEWRQGNSPELWQVSH